MESRENKSEKIHKKIWKNKNYTSQVNVKIDYETVNYYITLYIWKFLIMIILMIIKI